jgi:hypothetical protein
MYSDPQLNPGVKTPGNMLKTPEFPVKNVQAFPSQDLIIAL